jgi:hypothetical protein
VALVGKGCPLMASMENADSIGSDSFHLGPALAKGDFLAK